jgi:hypothetical protein
MLYLFQHTFVYGPADIMLRVCVCGVCVCVWCVCVCAYRRVSVCVCVCVCIHTFTLTTAGKQEIAESRSVARHVCRSYVSNCLYHICLQTHIVYVYLYRDCFCTGTLCVCGRVQTWSVCSY